MTAVVLRADARALPLPDASVDLICTSPPYYALRDYRDGDASLAGQIGSEATPAAYVAALLDCTREWMRVLKPQGSLFVNLGDKYSTGNSGESGMEKLGERWSGGGHSEAKAKRRSAAVPGMPTKCLLGLPWRYALGCIDDLGLILRAEIIWAKPNGLPESVTDRVRRSHEQVFHFTRQPRYYSAVDEVREVPTTKPQRRFSAQPVTTAGNADRIGGWSGHLRDMPGQDAHPLGKLPGSVWEIPSQPLTVPAALGTDHFAAFPMELPRRIIAGWSPPGICVACGEGRRPVVERDPAYLAARAEAQQEREVRAWAAGAGQQWGRNSNSGIGSAISNGKIRENATITGHACACPQPDAPTRPAIVADPFGGTGTTALVASVLGRDGFSFDRSADYCRLARWRTTDPGERARAMQVPKPPPQLDGQGDLFGLAEVAP